LHYDFEAIGDCTLAYMNRQNATKAMNNCNENAILDLVDVFLKMPAFQYASKNNTKKMIRKSRLIKVPKDWTYQSG
jgi:hypothetical protein